jgi:integrase/recombinase XerD
MKLHDAIAHFLTDRERRGCKSGSVKTYRKQLFAFSACLATMGIEDIEAVTRQHLEQFIDYERTRAKQKQSHCVGPLSAVSILHCIKSVRGFFNWATDTNIVPNNPTARLAMPKPARRLPKALKPHQVSRLLALPLQPREKAIIYLMIDTGLRLSEVSNLDLEDIDLSSRTCEVRQGKGDKDRMTCFSEETLVILQQWIDVRKTDPETRALFLSQHSNVTGRLGSRLTHKGLYQVIKRIAHEAKLDGIMHPPSLRHSFATMYLDNGGKINDLSMLMGHSDLTTTMIYWSVSTAGLSRQHDRFSPVSRLLDPPAGKE